MRATNRSCGLRPGKSRRPKISSRNLKNYISLDRIVSNNFKGEYTAPLRSNSVQYNIREIDSYCRLHGIKPENLSKEQLKSFILS